MRRIRTAELLDDDRGTPREIAESFNDLWWLNRNLGGLNGTIKLFDRALAALRISKVRILEVACGDGRLSAHVAERFAARGISMDFTLFDRRLSHIALGGNSNSRGGRVVGDALMLPFRDASFDFVFSNLFVHHLSEDEARTLFREAARVARHAVLINDLTRQYLAYLFIRLASPFARSRITRHDGPVSVRQAFSRRELHAIAESAGLHSTEMFRLPGLRMGLLAWTRGAHP